MKMTLRPFFLASGLIFFSACAGRVAKVEASAPASSAFDIGYVRGHNTHRCTAHAIDQKVTVRSFVDQQLLKESSLDRNLYETLFAKARSLLRNVKEGQKIAEPCRVPFHLTLREGESTESVNGCWAAEEGSSLSQLIKELEYGVASQKRG